MDVSGVTEPPFTPPVLFYKGPSATNSPCGKTDTKAPERKGREKEPAAVSNCFRRLGISVSITPTPGSAAGF